MIIYKDLFTGDELFADSFPYKLIDDLYYEVDGKIERRGMNLDVDALIGANPSAEDGDAIEGCDDSAQEKGINIALNHNLKDVVIDKKGYMGYVKRYMKKLAEKIKERDGEAAAKDMKEKLNNLFAKKIIPNFKNYEFKAGENFDVGDDDNLGMIALIDYRSDGVTPYFLYFKHGTEEEKC